jgi:hypothetical protein
MNIRLLFQPSSVLIIILFDLLYLPRILPLFGVPASLFLVIAYLLKNGIDAKKFLVLIGLVVVGFVSVLNGVVTKDYSTYIEDVKRILQIVTSLLFGLLYVRTYESHINCIVIMLRIFFVWLLLLALLLFMVPEFYSSINLLLYPEAAASLEDNVNALRFNYFFSDPNSGAYFVCIALCLYISLEKKMYFLIVTLLMAGVIVLLTQSRGGLVAFMFVLIYVFLKESTWSNKIVLLSIIPAIAFLIYVTYVELFDSLYLLYELRRDEEEASGAGLGGGRIGKYEYFLNNINGLPFGVGYSLFKDGIEFRPHSDLIRINFSYGLIFLLFVLYFAFPRRKDGLLIFSVFCVPFLVNTIIDDYKLLPLYLVNLNIICTLVKQNKEAVS